jgi:hypothetical protein
MSVIVKSECRELDLPGNPDVYYSPEMDNFYSRKDKRGMGSKFYVENIAAMGEAGRRWRPVAPLAGGTDSLPAVLPGHWATEEGREKALAYAGKARADLAHGQMSDLALANRVFMASRNDLDLIVWQTAAKDRIRWLSVQLAIANAALAAARGEGA